ncbi:hypothetical protein [Pseudoalteromonas sp. ND6B]|uniref:hypothetical protein n=1 Tax=Pseudoalteromonas sp. ND6B TaxID=1535421 RepID=UPI00051A8B7F|nr:hypothetical protein [Pseudoalteromonas sp. ND6B]KGJ96613.1 hypothetical protein ND6B_0180 [Pseudoalteromonas sp. ND6B]
MSSLEILDKQLDIANKALSLVFKTGLTIGGSVLLVYCWRIGYFPRDVSIGDGLLFLMLAIAFGGVYLLFTVSLTSLGITLRPIWNVIYLVFSFVIKIYNKFSGKKTPIPKLNIITAKAEHFVFALFGLLFVLGFGSFDIKVVGSLIVAVFSCAYLWSVHQGSGNEILDIESKENLTGTDNKRILSLKKHQKILVTVIFFIPLLFGGVSGKLLDGAMRLSNVKEDKVTVHIKQPYIKYVEAHNIKAKTSSLGDDYGTFENMNILFNGFGKNAVLIQNGIEKPINIIIPNDHLIVIQR